ncbi:hypothetical protein L9F63_023794, partial [Diploptera punctata]
TFLSNIKSYHYIFYIFHHNYIFLHSLIFFIIILTMIRSLLMEMWFLLCMLNTKDYKHLKSKCFYLKCNSLQIEESTLLITHNAGVGLWNLWYHSANHDIGYVHFILT